MCDATLSHNSFSGGSFAYYSNSSLRHSNQVSGFPQLQMAQTCQISRPMYHTSLYHIPAAPFSTAISSPILDGKQLISHLHNSSSSFYRSNDSIELLRAHHARVCSYKRLHHYSESQSNSVAQFCTHIGGKSWSLEAKRSYGFLAGKNHPRFMQGRNSELVWRAALPRPFSFLPSAGPIRDFLFATIGAVLAFLFAGILARIWCLEERYFRATAAERGTAAMPEMGSNPGKKESVEWVNMVIHKIWKVYRRSLEVWLVQLLQPAIDNLGKPGYVKRVEIAELNLDYEPLIVRNVQRRASRRANDLQYQFGLRYAGGARCLLNLKLGRAGVETSIPVGVYDLDVDGELWLKLRLAPVKPYVGTLSLAFVQLPTIKLVLAPFRVVNLFSIPFLSNFLSKLLTVDLPRLLVLPRHITFDFLPQGQNVMDSVEAMEASLESGAMDESIASGVLDLLKTGSTEPNPPQAEPSEAFVGELSVTVCDARDLPIRGFTGWSNPYCILALGDQVVESKRNKETSHPAGHKDPVWNQDFQFLVEDPRRQKLMLRVRDSTLTLNPNIGYCQINLAELKDCVPRSLWVTLKRDGLFGPKKVTGRVHLALTYKSFVDEDDEIGGDEDFAPYIKVYGDSGADSVEEIGVSLGEEIAASLREEAKGESKGGAQSPEEDDVEVLYRQREDSSVEVTSRQKASSTNSEETQQGANVKSRTSNGAISSSNISQKHPSEEGAGKSGDMDRRFDQGDGAVVDDSASSTMDGNGKLKSRDGNGSAHTYDVMDKPAGSYREGNGSAMGSLGNTNGLLKREGKWSSVDYRTAVGDFGALERVLAEEIEGLAGNDPREWNGNSAGTAQEVRGAPARVPGASVPIGSNPALKCEVTDNEMISELAVNEVPVQQVLKDEGNPKLLWLCIFTTVAYILGCSLHTSNPLHP